MATSEQIITADPERIRAWTEERGGAPMKKRGTGHSGMDPAILYVAFPGAAEDPSLEPFDWDEWLVELDEQRLAAVMGGEGADSTLKVVRRDRVVMSGE
ncbi:MAG: hypothetical protein QOG42_1351 [Solirubrobacteraceae bacterium]|jgi:hypothetical protein|nr:hypothetical protein [Solirubrobacteraceae bacterium]